MKAGIIQYLILIISATMIFTAVLGACTPPTQVPVAEHELCSSSGWHGIVPATTEVDAATEILGDLSFVDSQSVKHIADEMLGGEPSIVWQQYGGIPARRKGGMQVHDGRVVAIQAPLSFELSLEQALMDCGEPVLVKASFDGESPFHWYQFFYPDKGMLLLGRFEREQLDNAIIAPEIRIVEVEYFPPSDIDSYLTDIRHFTSKEIIEAYAEEFVSWPGLNESIPAYPF